MRLSQRGEIPLLNYIRERFPRKPKALKVGIGDDCAVIAPDKKNLLATTDMMVEGVHFDLSFTTPYQLGFKLISVNASDIYAMAGRPRYALLDIAMSPDTRESFLKRLLDGIAEACGLYGLSVIGGDLSSARREMSLSATVLGYSEKPLLRSGARPGDRIYVTGALGDSAAGLLLLMEIGRPVDLNRLPDAPIGRDVMEPLLRRHLMPVARKPGAVKRCATSMIDISDGLLIDLSRLCEESNAGAKIYEEAVPLSGQLRAAASYFGVDPMRLALTGGEDYELLFTAPEGAKIRGAACIGEIKKSGRVMVDASGRERKFKPEGYRHFEDKRQA
ncbi:MAG: thiamine-phosphate kinase [Thermodesulfovibrionales bacterium]|nr:thiamine-phosphate kinase [Thermodesulfovibrionales bacterium]